jgi:hypothetical protein
VAEANAAVSRAAGVARESFDKAALLARPRPGQPPPDPAAVVECAARGVAALLLAMDEADQRLAAAEDALKQMEALRPTLDQALDANHRRLTEEVAASDREIEAQRKRVQAQWDHLRSPRLSFREAEHREAALKLENMMNEAAAAWRERERQRAGAEAARDRRQRLVVAARGVADRQADVRGMRGKIEQFRAAMLNPLDGRRPQVALDRAEDWPKPLRPALDPLNEKAALPKVFKPPDDWKLEDRVKRFLTGGSP